MNDTEMHEAFRTFITAPGESVDGLAAIQADPDKLHRSRDATGGPLTVGKIVLSRPPATGFIRCEGTNESPTNGETT